jgi:hypothetical protein
VAAQRPRVADRADQVGVGDRPEVDEDRLAGEADRRRRAQPMAVDAHRLGAGRPQRVDHQLQVAVADLAAGVGLRRPADRVGVGVGSGVGEGDQQAGAADRDHRGGELGAGQPVEGPLPDGGGRQRVVPGGGDLPRSASRSAASRSVVADSPSISATSAMRTSSRPWAPAAAWS